MGDQRRRPEVENGLRAQERKMPGSKHETRAAFERRVAAAARSLSPSLVDAAIGDMRRWCRLLAEAKGGLFEEGGRARRPL